MMKRMIISTAATIEILDGRGENGEAGMSIMSSECHKQSMNNGCCLRIPLGSLPGCKSRPTMLL